MIVALAVAAIVALLFQAHQNARERDRALSKWHEERRELLERIQRPERVPQTEQHEPLVLPDVEPNEWALAGQVLNISDDYGLSDDG